MLQVAGYVLALAIVPAATSASRLNWKPGRTALATWTAAGAATEERDRLAAIPQPGAR